MGPVFGSINPVTRRRHSLSEKQRRLAGYELDSLDTCPNFVRELLPSGCARHRYGAVAVKTTVELKVPDW